LAEPKLAPRQSADACQKQLSVKCEVNQFHSHFRVSNYVHTACSLLRAAASFFVSARRIEGKGVPPVSCPD